MFRPQRVTTALPTLCCLVALMICVTAVPSSVFEEVYDEWEALERKFYAAYRAGDPFPLAAAPTRRPVRGPSTDAARDEEPLASSGTVLTPASVPSKDGKRSVPSLSDNNLGEPTAAVLRKKRGAADSNRNGYRVQPTTNNGGEVPQQQEHSADDNGVPSTPSEKDINVVVAAQQTAASLSSTSSSSRAKPSFSEVCGKDSADRCSNPNPFAATFCLVGKKDALSPECRDYVTAKVNCYLSTNKLCKDAASQLKCLYVNRNQASLPRVCTHTKFFEYVRGGVSVADVLLDTRTRDDTA